MTNTAGNSAYAGYGAPTRYPWLVPSEASDSGAERTSVMTRSLWSVVAILGRGNLRGELRLRRRCSDFPVQLERLRGDRRRGGTASRPGRARLDRRRTHASPASWTRLATWIRSGEPAGH